MGPNKTIDQSQITNLLQKCHSTGKAKAGVAFGRNFLQENNLNWQEANTSFLDHYSICCFYAGEVQESFEITTYLLDYRSLSASDRGRINSNRHFCIPEVKDDYIGYPQEIVERIHNRAPRANPQVTFSITTCKRTDLFIRTMNSFLQCCRDINLVDEWICVDDNTPEDERQIMRERYPFFRFIWKSPEDKGHARSMNLIRQQVNTPFLFHCEDDRQFFSPKPFISEALRILETDPDIGQVVVNRNYGESADDHKILGGIQRETLQSIQYIMHEHYPPNSDEMRRFLMFNQGLQVAYWPHFSLNPSLIRTSAWETVGAFYEDAQQFELDYAQRYYDAGYRTCFFNTIYCLHIGRLTRERGDPSKPNAYILNQEGQIGQDKRTIRVKPIGFWCDSKELCEILDRQSQGNCRWNDIELTWQDDADYFVIFQCPRGDDFFIPGKTIVFQTEADSEHHPEVWGHPWADPDPTQFLQVRRHRDFPNIPDWHLGLSYTELKDGSHPSKTKLISTVVSSNYWEPGHIKRIDFLKYYQNYPGVPKIDIYGYDNAHNFTNYLGPLPARRKADGLLPYRYTFHAENQAIHNYYTEKIVDAILAETLCFYWGCPNLEEIIDSRAFIRLNLDDPQGSARVIEEAIDNDEWSRRLPAIRREKARILDEMQFFPTMERILKEVYLPIYCINLDRRPDRWETFRQNIQPHWENYVRFPAIDALNLELTENEKRIFASNVFGNRRTLIACSLSHLALWRQLAADEHHDQYLIMEDDVEFCQNFGNKLLEVHRRLKDKPWDLVFLGAHIWREGRDPSLYNRTGKDIQFVNELHHHFGGSFAYLISKEAARKMVEKIDWEGMDDAVDGWKMKQYSWLEVSFVVPFMAYSDYAYDYKEISGVDSDIQYDFKPLF